MAVLLPAPFDRTFTSELWQGTTNPIFITACSTSLRAVCGGNKVHRGAQPHSLPGLLARHCRMEREARASGWLEATARLRAAKKLVIESRQRFQGNNSLSQTTDGRSSYEL